ncbi:MAG: NADH:flavin oxidoreductase [Deltaproteobacteria bacterium]|nr:NADH:flavin oxidoreductase [Deltaproteobacteria bacterium]
MVDPSTIAEALAPMSFPSGAVARNAVWLAPMTNVQSEPDGALSEVEARWLLRRAEGGFGVVMTCAAYVSQDGKAWVGQLGIDHDDRIPRLTELASGLRERGALGVVQLFHGGARAPAAVSGAMPWTASEVAEARSGLEVSRAATEDDIAKTITAFVEAAVRARRAGFDGVEVHGAHAYVLSQFLSTTMNRRDDRWGGPLEGRARFLREVVRGVRAACPAPFLVGVRLSPEDYASVTGLDLDESATVARWLAEDGVDWVHASLWDHRQRSRKYLDENPFTRIRAAVPARVPVVAAGAFWTPAEVVAWRAEHGPGPIALGRAAILNPDWPRLAGTPGWEPRRPPMSPDELAAVDVGPPFVAYLRRWKGFVA